jgi:hypothetical protein
VDLFRPELVMVVGGAADISDHRIDGEWQHIGQPAYDSWLLGQMQDFADRLTAGGARLVWTTVPDIRPPKPPGVTSFAEEDPARMARYNELIAELAAGDPRIELADLSTVVKQRAGGQFDPTLRPDGVHIDLRVAPDLVDWLAEQIRTATA